jgi:hypothetical protein
VATEWLFSVPEHVLEKHLAAEPGTPTAHAPGDGPDTPEDQRVTLPRRVPLQARTLPVKPYSFRIALIIHPVPLTCIIKARHQHARWVGICIATGLAP